MRLGAGRKVVRRRERGSTILYAVVISGVGAALALANMQVATTARSLQLRRENETRWLYVKAAAAARLDAELRALPAFTPSTLTVEVGEESYEVAVAAAATPKRFLLTITNARYGVATTEAYDPRGKHPFLYSLFVDSNANLNADLLVGKSTGPGHACFDGAINAPPHKIHRVYGALDVKNATLPNFDTIGLGTTGIDRPEMTTPLALSYSVGANFATTGDRSFGTGTYGTGTSNYVIFVGGTASIGGTIRGRVTLYANKIYIDPPLRMADANSKLVLVSKGDVIVDDGGTIEAFVYTDKKIEVKDGDVTWTGAIACGDIDMTDELTITPDPFFYDAAELVNFRVPRNGYGLD